MTEPTDATSTLLVDWATRIEVEFLLFKQTINDALLGVPDEELQPKAKSIKSLEGKLDTLVSSVKSLIKQVNNLERLKPRCGNVCADNVLRVSTLDSQLFSLKCEIGNLRDLQDQLIKNHHVQAVLTEDKRRYEGTRVTDDRLRTDVLDIKYFLKLLLPKVVAMQADSHKIKALNAQLVQLLGRVGDAAIPSQDHESYSDRELSIRRRRPRVLLPAEDDLQHPKKKRHLQ
jgi:hypothetical protein